MRKLIVIAPEALQAALKQEEIRSPQSRFVHRLHCVLLVGQGHSCYEVAQLFQDDPRSIERWVHALRRHGIDGLREKQHSGRPAQLSHAQLYELQLALERSPRELGYSRDRWSATLLQGEILRRFRVKLSARQCRRIEAFLRLAKSAPCNTRPAE